jgi:DNA helicase IV
MKPLGVVTPTPEQLTVIEDDSPGFWLIRGAAGSGKTTTALYRLKFLVRLWRERAKELGSGEPVRVLVLTFNRSLRGYIETLADQQIPLGADVSLEVETFARWAVSLVNREVMTSGDRAAKLKGFAEQAGGFPWEPRFLAGEVDYVLGQLLPADLRDYLAMERTGRGQSPRVTRALRRRLLDDVILPYNAWKEAEGLCDWNDLAVALALEQIGPPYNVVVVDEAQDFSANQMRAIVRHLADDHVTTFIRDTAQRIYPNGFGAWSDVGISIPNSHNKRLATNYRNTKQIAAFARPLLEGVEVTEDASFPDFTGCFREGPRPVVIRGRYHHQLDWAINYLRSGQVGSDETVAFLHPLGWFGTLKARLAHEKLDWSLITKAADWPDGPEQIGLSTMASAKGLEFGHVIIIGYNAEVVPAGEEPNDSLLDEQRRLLAMSVGRARQFVALGYKPSDSSAVVDFLDDSTYDVVDI